MRNLKIITLVCVLTGVILVSNFATLSSSLVHAQSVTLTSAKTLTLAPNKFKPACPFKVCPKTPTPVVTKTPTPSNPAYTDESLTALLNETNLIHMHVTTSRLDVPTDYYIRTGQSTTQYPDATLLRVIISSPENGYSYYTPDSGMESAIQYIEGTYHNDPLQASWEAIPDDNTIPFSDF